MYSVHLRMSGALSQHSQRAVDGIATMGIEIDNLLPSLCVEHMLHEGELSWSLQQHAQVVEISPSQASCGSSPLIGAVFLACLGLHGGDDNVCRRAKRLAIYLEFHCLWRCLR